MQTFPLLSLILLFATITVADAVPIASAFTSPLAFTLEGTQYTGFYRLTFYADITKNSLEDLLNTKVLRTVVGGEVVFQAVPGK